MPEWVYYGSGNAVTWGGRAMCNAIQNKHSNVASWMVGHGLHTINTDNNTEKAEIVDAALEAGDEMVLLAVKLMSSNWELELVRHCPTVSGILAMLDRKYFTHDQNAVCYAIWTLSRMDGHLDLMQKIAEACDPPPCDVSWKSRWRKAIEEACEHGELPKIAWLMEHPTGRQVCQDMKENNELDLLMNLAAMQGSVEVLEYLYGQGVSDSSADAVYFATQKGKLESVEWLFEHITYTKGNFSDSVNNVFEAAATGGHLKILQYLFGLDASSVPGHLPDVTQVRNPIDLAAKFGHLSVVQWLYQTRSNLCTATAMDEAASNGHLEVVQWLEVNTTVGCTNHAMEWAAAGGHLETLQWLYAKRPNVCTAKLFQIAVRSGNIRVVYWMAKQFPTYVPEKDVVSSCSEDKFEVLLFLFEHYPSLFTPGFVDSAQQEVSFFPQKASHVEVIDWLESTFYQ